MFNSLHIKTNMSSDTQRSTCTAVVLLTTEYFAKMTEKQFLFFPFLFIRNMFLLYLLYLCFYNVPPQNLYVLVLSQSINSLLLKPLQCRIIQMLHVRMIHWRQVKGPHRVIVLFNNLQCWSVPGDGVSNQIIIKLIIFLIQFCVYDSFDGFNSLQQEMNERQ